jgi:hypothetical protein
MVCNLRYDIYIASVNRSVGTDWLPSHDRYSGRGAHSHQDCGGGAPVDLTKPIAH